MSHQEPWSLIRRMIPSWGIWSKRDRRLVICKGGRGGRGNTRFKTSKNKAPRLAEKGEPPEVKNIRLELKLIADIGIIGVPNAGKSTLLSVVSNAKPKIAPYPFTTLQPNLGVVDLDDEIHLILADIPGLIEGAHRGEGLGHDFLKHIQRTRVLIHVLDGTSGRSISWIWPRSIQNSLSSIRLWEINLRSWF